MAKLKERIDSVFCEIRYWSKSELIDTIIDGKFLIEVYFDHPYLSTLTIPYWGKVHHELIEGYITEYLSIQLKKELCIE